MQNGNNSWNVRSLLFRNYPGWAVILQEAMTPLGVESSWTLCDDQLPEKSTDVHHGLIEDRLRH